MAQSNDVPTGGYVALNGKDAMSLLKIFRKYRIACGYTSIQINPALLQSTSSSKSQTFYCSKLGYHCLCRSSSITTHEVCVQ